MTTMDMGHNEGSKNAILKAFAEIIKDLSPDEVKDAMNYVSTLTVQHTQEPSLNHQQKDPKQQ